MTILFILGLLLGAFAVVFTLQNTVVVTVNFFSYDFTGSLSIVLALAVLSGVIITLLLILPESIKNYFKNRKLRKENSRLEDELKKQKELTTFAKVVPAKPEDIQRIEEGAIDMDSENKIL